MISAEFRSVCKGPVGEGAYPSNSRSSSLTEGLRRGVQERRTGGSAGGEGFVPLGDLFHRRFDAGTAAVNEKIIVGGISPGKADIVLVVFPALLIHFVYQMNHRKDWCMQGSGDGQTP